MTGGGGTEQPLPGGLGSGGLVVRVGDTVRRPPTPQGPAVRAFLEHLEAVGFEGAPRFLGVDERGRDVLSWVEGEVALPPFPAWAAHDGLLASVAELQRRLHHAARTFVPPAGAVWDTANLLPPGPDAVVTHNDLCVENVVVRDGVAVAFIDFDFAAPASPLLDIAIAARHWVPLRDPADIDPGWAGVDQVARFHALAGGHGLGSGEREAVVEQALGFLDRALESMRTRAEAGLPLYAKVWAAGYPQQNRRSRAWVERHRAAVVGG